MFMLQVWLINEFLISVLSSFYCGSVPFFVRSEGEGGGQVFPTLSDWRLSDYPQLEQKFPTGEKNKTGANVA